MSNRGLWLEGGTTFPDGKSRTLAIGLAVAWCLLIAAKNGPHPSGNPLDCGSDPWDFLAIGEMIELQSLAYIVQAHCPKAKYSRDGWIELHYGGGRVDVQLHRVDVAGTTYFRIVSIGGATTS